MSFTAETFVSYAQNLEDVMLWRALKHVEGGFYLDVGAWSPDEDSITRAFYERGWSGINLEPNLEWQRQLHAKRERDINLAVAVSDAPGEETFYFFGDLGLSTMDRSVAEAHMAEGWQATPRPIPVTTLEAVWAEHVGERPVHFLKVDVEGLEERVLRGLDWRARRPWIVMVESTRPMSQVETHETWEPLLLEADYRLGYCDGLNRYYVASEHSELLEALRYPPNVFDRFKLAAHQAAEERAETAEATARAAEARAEAAEAAAAEASARADAVEASARARLAEAEATLEAVRAEAAAAATRLHAALVQTAEAQERAATFETHLHNVYASKSWRWTAPLRWLKGPLAALRLMR